MTMKIRKCLFLWLSLSFMTLGCRHTSIQENADWPNPGPVDVATLPPIQNVINHGTTDPDKMLQQKDLQQAEAHAASDPDSSSKFKSAPPIVLGTVADEQPNESAPSGQAEQTAHVQADEPPPPTDALIQATQAALPPINQQPAAPVQPTTTENSPPPAPLPPVDAQTPTAQLPPADAQTPPAPLPPVDSQTQKVSVEEPAPPATLPPATPIQSPTAPAPPVTGVNRSGDANQDAMDIHFDGLSPTAVSAGRVAAHVGSEIITVYDLNVAIQDWIKANVPPGQSIPPKDRLMMAKMVLSQMIDRMLIIQEAHRMMKSEKQKEALFKQIDHVWTEQQIPPLMKKYKVETTYDLDQVLKKQGRSLDKAKKEFTNDALAHEFMGMKLGGKTFVSLVEMRRYYNEHINEFHEPAKITWREIRVPIDPTDKPGAEAESQKILKELQQHSDFATLATRSSKGATAEQGGLWETSPDGFAVKEVNDALRQMKPGQMAGPIETSESIFFVKLETRREAGPARFDEVQTQIQEKIRNEKLGKASSGFIIELRKNTVVQTIFDDANLRDAGPAPNRDSNLSRTSNPSATQAAPAAQSVAASPQQTNDSATASAQSSSDASSDTTQPKHINGFPTFGNPANRVPEASEEPQPEPPPALAPAGALPPRGMMKGPSQPSPL